jgi:hypothetical protein
MSQIRNTRLSFVVVVLSRYFWLLIVVCLLSVSALFIVGVCRLSFILVVCWLSCIGCWLPVFGCRSKFRFTVHSSGLWNGFVIDHAFSKISFGKALPQTFDCCAQFFAHEQWYIFLLYYVVQYILYLCCLKVVPQEKTGTMLGLNMAVCCLYIFIYYRKMYIKILFFTMSCS